MALDACEIVTKALSFLVDKGSSWMGTQYAFDRRISTIFRFLFLFWKVTALIVASSMIGLIFNWSYSRFRNRFWSIWETIQNYWLLPLVFWSSTEPVVVSSWFVGTNGDGNVESLLNLMIAVTCDTPSVEGGRLRRALCAVARQQLGSSSLWGIP